MTSNRINDDDLRTAIEALRALLPPGVVLAGGPLARPDATLYPEEARAVAKSVAKRRREFIAGRAYARDALRALGIEGCAIPVGPGRAPVWPTGIVGSITHTHDVCAAVVAHDHCVAGLGLDMESAEPLDPSLVPLVCLEPELRQRVSVEAPLRADLPKILFVIKESVYKLDYPLTGRALEFHDVAVTLGPEPGRFDARILAGPAIGGAHNVQGRYGVAAGYIHACIGLPIRHMREPLHDESSVGA